MSEESQQFLIQKIYLKDVSYESPNAPQAFIKNESTPSIQIQINTSHNVVAQDVYEVVLDITLTAKEKDSTAFLVEIKQAGVFNISGFDKESLAGMLGVFCPESLFPFAREAISELISKGGFQPFLMAPVNFNALYAEQVQQQQQAAAPEQEQEKVN